MRSDSATHLAALTTLASPPLRAWLHRRADPVGAVLDRILTMRGRDRGAFIPGARKYAGQMKAILNAAGLAGLEAQGPGYAYDAATRDKLWPRYDAEEQRAAGDSAGAAYLKTKIRSYIVARPDDTPAARAAYRAEIARLRDYLDIIMGDGYADDAEHLLWVAKGKVSEIESWAKQICSDSEDES